MNSGKYSQTSQPYGFYFDRYGFIHSKCFVNDIPKNNNRTFNEDVNSHNNSSSNDNRVIGSNKEVVDLPSDKCAVWLRFIVLFWNPRVLKAAVKFGLAAMIMNKYERLGFAIMLLCFAF